MTRTTKRVPPGATQHATAGAFSPVLLVDARQLVVISGQASIDMQGRAVGSTIEEQTRVTLENCLKQLQTAGCTFEDVFKVNVYLADVADWPAFNAVYSATMPQPYPVRTTVGSALLAGGFLVEIEMWAASPPSQGEDA